MEKISHRINTVEQLKNLPAAYGAEIDIRYHENQLILHHDPLHHHEDPKPETLENFLKHWQQEGHLILNIKTEGIEKNCIELMNQYQIKKWFFLDLSMPYCVKYAEHAIHQDIKGFGIQNLAVRFSEHEPIEYALSFKNKAGWVWIDCFTKFPLNHKKAEALKEAGFKICLVSPELQKHDASRIEEFKKILSTEKITIDAVCTKKPELWD